MVNIRRQLEGFVSEVVQYCIVFLLPWDIVLSIIDFIIVMRWINVGILGFSCSYLLPVGVIQVLLDRIFRIDAELCFEEFSVVFLQEIQVLEWSCYHVARAWRSS